MILVTGAGGFVGSALCARLSVLCFPYRVVTRSQYSKPVHSDWAFIHSIDSQTNWQMALKNIEIVVHLAARVHIMYDACSDPLSEFRRVNVEGTEKLAKQAVLAGVKRFIYISSVKVNGESTSIGNSFMADDVPGPRDPYAVSKLEAEIILNDISRKTGMEVVIIRPPLIYGPNVKGNFDLLLRCLQRGFPLPFAGITNNKRSLVSLANFVDLIVTCLTHRSAANKTFLVSDDEDVSTSSLLCRLNDALGKPGRIYYFPPNFVRFMMLSLGKPEIYQRLCGSLQLDIEKTKKILSWKPIETLDDGLKRFYSTRDGNNIL